MRRVYLIAFLVCLSNFVFSQQVIPTNDSTIINNLNLIENIYFKYLNPEEKKEAIRLLNETKYLVIDISDNSVSNSQIQLNVLNEAGFQALYDNVKKELSDDTKNTIILSIGKNGKITSSQLARLISLYSFDVYKEKLIKLISNNIIDPVNIGEVLGYFDSSVTRNQLAEYFRTR